MNKTEIANEARKLTKEKFLERFITLHGTEYDLILDSYNGFTGNDIILICKTHGESIRSPANLMQATFPCKVCANEHRIKTKTGTYALTVAQMLDKHDNKYFYPIENEKTYVNKRSKIKIICPEHDEFYKSTQKHLSGQGCFKCKVAEMIANGILLGGYSEEYFNKSPERKLASAVLYYIKVGSIFKIGITTNFYNRIKSIKSESKKSVDIIKQKEYNLFDAFNIEQSILKDFDEYRTYRNWSTEVFSIDIYDKISKHF